MVPAIITITLMLTTFTIINSNEMSLIPKYVQTSFFEANIACEYSMVR